MKSHCTRLSVVRLAAGIIAFFSVFVLMHGVAYTALTTQDCLTCHNVTPTAAQQAKPVSLYVNQKLFHSSVHSAIGCTGCHGDITSFPHKPAAGKVACQNCHADQATAYDESVHVAASRGAKLTYPACLSCHGNPHQILEKNDPKSRVYPLNLPRTCGVCHGNPSLAKRYGLADVYQLYIDSIHGFALTKDGLLVAATCTSCHGAHRILSRSDPRSRTYRSNIPATCGSCHAKIQTSYLEGVHGRAVTADDRNAPVCTSCHKVHAIARVRTAAWQVKTVATCGECHKESLASYRDTFHGQITALGYDATARCWNCHGAHRILPQSDPHSSIARANLVATCRKCHSGATPSFVSYEPHPNPYDKSLNPGLFYAALFMNALLLGVFAFFGLHTLLWLIRSASAEAHSESTPNDPKPGANGSSRTS
jgi:hypothetical protein